MRVLHRAVGARRRGQPPDGRHRARGRGARGRRRARGHAARPERQLLRSRPRRRPVPPAVRRPAARARRGRRHRAHPLHVAAPQGPPPRDDRGDGRVRDRVRAPAPARCSRAATARWRACTAATRPSATSSGSRRRAPRSPTSPSPPTSSSASPARPTPTSTARSTSSRPRAYDAAYTFVFSPRPGHAAAATMTDDFVAPEVAQERMQRLIDVVERHALAQARGARRARRGGARRRPVEEGPDDAGRAAPARTSSCTSRPAPSTRAGRPVEVRITRAAPHWLRGRARRRRRPAPPARVRIPVAAGAEPRRHAPRARRPDRVGQVRRSRSPRRARSATSRSSRSTRCRSTAGSTSARRSRRAAERAAVAHHLIDVADPSEDWSVARFQAAARAAVADIEARGQRALLVGGTGLYVQAVVDDLAFPPRTSTLRAELEARDRRAAAGSRRRTRELARRRSGRPRRGSSRGNARRIVRALEVIRAHRPAVLVVRAGHRRRTARTVFPVAHGRRRGCRRAELARRIDRAVRRDARRRPRRRGRDGARRRPGGSRAPPAQAIGYKEVLDAPRRARCRRSTPRSTRPSAAPGAFARRQRVWFRRDPRITWLGARPRIRAAMPAGASLAVVEPMSTLQLAKLHATGNDFLVQLDADCDRDRRRTRPRRRALRPPPRHRRRRADHRSARAPTAPTAR